MADENIIEKVHELSDLELATLICLVAQEHCIIDTEPDALDDLVHELALVVPIQLFNSFLANINRLRRKSLVYPMQ